MNNKPLVSILIPCYNHECFLDDCLNSIIKQTYENIEVLICDDCSSDGSFEKIKSYEDKLKSRFKRAVILKNETNCGVTANVNRLLKESKGEYLKTLASDDALAPEALEKAVDFFEKNDDISVVVANGIKVPENQHYPDFHSNERLYAEAPDFSQNGFFERVAIHNEISAPAAMVRRKIYEEYGYYDETIKIEDFEFWLRILKEGKVKFGFVNQDLIFYRINSNSMSSVAINESTVKRRRLMHFSELKSLYKYRRYMRADIFSYAVLNRMLTERSFAVNFKFWEYEKEIKSEIDNAFRDLELSFPLRLRALLTVAKQSIKKMIKR